MILGPKVGVLPTFVAKLVGNNYCTDTSVQPAIVEVRECSIHMYVCVVLGSQSDQLLYVATLLYSTLLYY